MSKSISIESLTEGTLPGDLLLGEIPEGIRPFRV